MKKHLIVYAKRPFPGYAKTRLGDGIGLEESAGVYARFLYRCLLGLLELDRGQISIELSLASADDISYFRCAFPEFMTSAQGAGDLGDRFTQSFRHAFENGAQAVVVIGTDIPDLDRSIIDAAFNELDTKDVVVGPDMDGGYYLIGTTQKSANLFQDIAWSSELVLQQTERLIGTQNLSLGVLPVLSDVDTTADYQRWLSTKT